MNTIHALRSARCFVGTDCEYVTKELCEKSLNEPTGISYPRCEGLTWRFTDAHGRDPGFLSDGVGDADVGGLRFLYDDT